MAQSSTLASHSLNFISLNPAANETILLLHTGFSSHRDFTLVTPHLVSQDYHLLLPDLPAHGRSTSSSIPFSPANSIALLADLLSREAHDGKAHIVGVSLGGFLGLYLAATYPDVVRSVFVSGCGRDLTSSWNTGYYAAAVLAIGFPTLVLGVVWLPRWAYDALYRTLGLHVPEGLQADQRAAAGYGVGFALARALVGGKVGVEKLRRVSAKVLLVAAGADDDVDGTRWMGGELRGGNGESRAARVQGMRHVWCLQDAQLFAQGVHSWLKEGKMIDEFEVL